MHEVHEDFAIQAGHLLPTGKPDLRIFNNNNNKDKKDKEKITCQIEDFAVLVDTKVKIEEIEKLNKYQDLARERKKYMEYGGDSDTNCNWCTRNNPLKLSKRAWKILKAENEQTPSKLQYC